MDGKDRANPNLAGAVQIGRGAPGCARACHCLGGGQPCGTRRPQQSPPKGGKAAKSPESQLVTIPVPMQGGDLGGRSTGSPWRTRSPFNLHPPPPSVTLLFLITLFLTRTSNSNSCGPGAADRGDGEGPRHARTETQLKKVEYGLTKNKRQVSCLPLSYARWRGGDRAGGTQGGLLSFSCLPPPSRNPPSQRPELRLISIPCPGRAAGALGDGDVGGCWGGEKWPGQPL